MARPELGHIQHPSLQHLVIYEVAAGTWQVIMP